MEKFIQWYFSLNDSDGNMNITDYNNIGSLRALDRKQTKKYETKKYYILRLVGQTTNRN